LINTLAGIFIILHGTVHFWYVVLSFGWVKFQPDMGWTGQSWLFSPFLKESILRPVEGILFAIAALLFFISGISIFFQPQWMNTILLISSVFSSLILVLFWDGSMGMIVQKGIIGLIINVVVAVIVLT
jgi:hypothetical protein